MKVIGEGRVYLVVRELGEGHRHPVSDLGDSRSGVGSQEVYRRIMDYEAFVSSLLELIRGEIKWSLA